MAGMTSYLQKKILDDFLSLAAYTPPSNLYLSLHTADPTDAGSFAAEVSTSGTGYARQLITGSMNFTDSSSGISQNTSPIAFPVITGAYGTVTHIGISSALTGGTMLFSGPITEPQNKTVGESYQFATGQLSIQLQ